MRIKAFFASILAFFLLLFGFGKTARPELPADAVAFEMGTFIDEADDQAAYGAIEYAGRTYLPYGTLRGTLRNSEIDVCVGYLVQDGVADTDQRIYTLADDPAHNYLMQDSAGSKWMDQPLFWRAVDTRGAEIATPSYINPPTEGYWT